MIDGDTIEVLANWRVNRVRLYGVDCPESKQPYGRRAKQFTSSASYFRWAKVHTVTVDRYGRRVGTVTLPDNKVLNHELVRAGYAWWYRQYAPDDSTLEAVEKDARAAKRGLWSQKNPTPPWEWRERRR
ncbi:MAG: nuclease [Planctomycetes bacterium]|nr:nuclease [Planctomycetota bacterium]